MQSLRSKISNEQIATALICLLIGLLAILVRLETMAVIEAGGDAIRKWMLVKMLYLGKAAEYWEWNHHSVRLGVNLPAYLCIMLLGTKPWVYYVPTITFFALTSSMTYLIGKKIHGQLVGVLAALALIFQPDMVRAGAQLLPSIYSAAYIAFAMFCLFSIKTKSQHRNLLVGLAAFFVFLGYLSKIQTLFFAPGFCIAIYLLFKNEKDYRRMLLVFCGTLAALYVIETLLYFLFTDFPLGQLQITMKTYGHSGRLERQASEVKNVLALFNRFTVLPTYFANLVAIFGVCSIAMIAFPKKINTKTWCIAFMIWSFFFFMTFTLKKLHPLTPMTLFHSRYLEESIPFMILLCCSVVVDLAKAHLPRRGPVVIIGFIVVFFYLVSATNRLSATRNLLFAVGLLMALWPIFFDKKQIFGKRLPNYAGLILVLLVFFFPVMMRLGHNGGYAAINQLAKFEALSQRAHDEMLPVYSRGPVPSIGFKAYRAFFSDQEQLIMAGTKSEAKLCPKVGDDHCLYYPRDPENDTSEQSKQYLEIRTVPQFSLNIVDRQPR